MAKIGAIKLTVKIKGETATAEVAYDITFSKTDIKVGDTLIVDGYLAKSGGKIIDARRVTLPNGRVVSGGTPGDGGPQDTGATKPGS